MTGADATPHPGTPLRGLFAPSRDGRPSREDRYRGIVERLPAVLYIDSVEPDRAMIDISPDVEALFGIARDELLERPNAWVDAIHPEDLDRVVAENERTRPRWCETSTGPRSTGSVSCST